eukprot:scaffold39466_cov62-Phaeocystis_antarctica.AAC.9
MPQIKIQLWGGWGRRETPCQCENGFIRKTRTRCASTRRNTSRRRRRLKAQAPGACGRQLGAACRPHRAAAPRSARRARRTRARRPAAGRAPRGAPG